VAFSTTAARPRPSISRAGRPAAIISPGLATDVYLGTSDLLASIIPGGVDYDNTGSGFWDRASDSAGGDIGQVALLAIGFPIAITLVFYKDQIFAEPVEVEPPRGWRKVPSRSRPGKFSYENVKTKERYDRIPNWAWDEK